MSIQKSVLKNTSFLIASRITSQVFAFFTVILIARQLGEIGLGLYSFAFAFTEILGLISDIGIYTLVIRDVARNKEHAEKYHNNYLSLKMLLSVAFLIIGTIILAFLPFTFEKKLIIFLAIVAYSFYKLTNPMLTILRAQERMGFEAIFEIADKATTLLAVIIAIAIDLGLVTILLGMIISRILLFCISYFYIKNTAAITPKWSFDPSFWKYLMKESVYFWFINILSIVYFQVDSIMLGFIHGDAAVGLYNASYRLVAALSFIPIALMGALFPITARLYKENRELLREIFLKTFRYLLLLAIPILVGTVILAPQIIQLLYTEKFNESILVLQILIFAQMLVFFNHIASITLNSIDLQKKVTKITAATLVLNVILNAILIPKYSYNGAALATVASEIINIICLQLTINKLIIQTSFWQLQMKWTFLRAIIAAAVMGILLYFSAQSFEKSYYVLLLLFIGTIIYGIILLITKEITIAEVKKNLNLLKKEQN